MPQLDNYLVSLGMKGQNVVLSTLDKIRKKSGELTKKKKIVTLSANFAAEKAAAKKELAEAGGTTAGFMSPPGEKPDKKFSKAVDKFSGGAKDIASAASSLDPTATISSITSALGTTLSGISVFGVSLGRLPEGVAAIANSTLSMAKNSIDMAKQSTAAYHQLATRNAAAEHYGGMVDAGPMSRNERAMFIDAVSNSMGRIGKPLAEELNKLIGNKDTRALARAGAGDWESTGTDKGWLLGQVSSSFQGLPPSIKQKLQAALLKNYSSEIQGMMPGQVEAQGQAAKWADMEESQTAQMAKEAPQALPMAKRLNEMQMVLYKTGVGFADSIDTTITKLKGLGEEIPRLTTAIKNFIDNPSFKSARVLIKSQVRSDK